MKLPFYYGWVIWLFSTLGVLFSIPGQTMGMAVFTDYLIEALSLSRTELSIAYLCGTVASSLFLTTAGRWYDRFGGRKMITVASVMLGLMVLFISLTDKIAALIGFSFSFPLILLGYFGVRFFGQGILTSCSQNVLLHWFIKRRGLVIGARGVFISFGFSIAPLFIAWLIMLMGWRGALWAMAGVIGIGFASLAWIFIRDNPASLGLLPDGEAEDAVTEHSIQPAISKDLNQARRDPVFWLTAASLAMHALFGTALTFHVVSIFDEAGRSATEAFAYFLPAAVFSTITNLLASSVVDKLPLKPFLVTMLSLFILGAWGLLHLDQTWGYWLLIAGFGSGGGLWALISNLSFIRFYGPDHIGAISGLSTSVTVFASAMGPAAFALGLDFQGSYQGAIMFCLFLLTLLLAASLLIEQEELSPIKAL